MSSLVVKVRLGEGGVMPQYQTPGSAGADVCCNEAFEIGPMEQRSVSTGLFLEIPPGFEAQVRPRSGLAAKHGIGLVNSPGTIDSDYRGEVKILLINFGKGVVKFETGDRIAQIVFCPVVQARFDTVLELSTTSRGEGGFGSTGI